jgi:signal transduction histidine kinase
VQETFYRIAQEALNNVLKHADAQQVAIRYTVRGDGAAAHARLEVIDDGSGFDADATRASGHFGLGIMAERAAAAGAQLAVDTAPGRGTRVVLAWSADRVPE